MRSISPSLLVLAILANLAAQRFGSFFLPDRLYFSFSAFLFDTRDLNRPLAILFKLLVPFVTSFAIAALLLAIRRAGREVAGRGAWVETALADKVPLTLAFAAFGSAFAWLGLTSCSGTS